MVRHEAQTVAEFFCWGVTERKWVTLRVQQFIEQLLLALQEGPKNVASLVTCKYNLR